jgi:hypothetical protein
MMEQNMRERMSETKSINRRMKSPAKPVRHAMLLMLTILVSGCAGLGAQTADPLVLATAEPLCKAAVTEVCLSGAEIDALTDKSARTIAKNNEGLRAACPKSVKKCPKEAPPKPSVPAALPPAAKSDPATS